MSFTVKGKLTKVLDMVTGTSTRGEWKKREFVIETHEEQYPKTIAFTLFNDKTSLIEGFQVGSDIEVSFQVESREYQGRYFHNVNAWRTQPGLGATQAPQQPQPQPAFTPQAPTTVKENENSDDLPF